MITGGGGIGEIGDIGIDDGLVGGDGDAGEGEGAVGGESVDAEGLHLRCSDDVGEDGGSGELDLSEGYSSGSDRKSEVGNDGSGDGDVGCGGGVGGGDAVSGVPTKGVSAEVPGVGNV